MTVIGKRFASAMIGLLFTTVVLLSVAALLSSFETLRKSETIAVRSYAESAAAFLNENPEDMKTALGTYGGTVYNMALFTPGGILLGNSESENGGTEDPAAGEAYRDALTSGRGEAVSRHGILGGETFIYTVRLRDGSVLRVAKTTRGDTVLLALLPPIVLLSLLLFFLTRFAAGRLTLSVAHTVSTIGQTGGKAKVYSELQPFARGLERRAQESEAEIEALRDENASLTSQIDNLRMDIAAGERERQGLQEQRRAFYTTAFAALAERIAAMTPGGAASGADSRIAAQTELLLRAIGNIVRLAELDERAAAPEQTPFDVHALAESVAAAFAEKVKAKALRLELRGASAELHANRRMMEELLQNLMDNAVLYSREGGLVAVTVASAEDMVDITVADTGIGIPSEHLERVFERFYRTEPPRPAQCAGFGLGLCVVKQIVELQGGGICLESEVNKGTRIVCRFPRGFGTGQADPEAL